MILKCTSFEGMQREIVGRDMSIVVFGAGVIGTVTVPEILRRYDLLGRVAFYVDNGPNIQGRRITLQDRSVDVKPAKALNGVKDNTVLIIAVSRYAEIVSQLERMPRMRDMSCYLMPMMCIHNFCSDISGGEPILSDKPLIPKKNTLHVARKKADSAQLAEVY